MEKAVNIIEETIEQKLDRINTVVQTTMYEMDISSSHVRNDSRISYLNSYTNSCCIFDSIDESCPIEEKLETKIERNIESLFLSLDRAQMQIEDFHSESVRNIKNVSLKDEELKKYIEALETENNDLRVGQRREKKNQQLENERKNFEEKLVELDNLISTYKTKHRHISVLEESLKTKEKLLNEKEKELRREKISLDKSKSLWEQSKSQKNLGKKFKLDLKENVTDFHLDSSVKSNQLLTLQHSLKSHELKLLSSIDEEEKARSKLTIEALRNKISSLKSEQVMQECNKSSRIMNAVKKTMEKEVNYEENLRKISLERYAVKGSNKGTPKESPVKESTKSFLFKE